MPAAVELTGDRLTIDDVWDVAVSRRPAALGDLGRERAAAARSFLESQVGDHTYGVNTGFGRFVSETIPPEQAEELQLRLLRSHACGVGEPYPDDVVRAAMLLRANALAKGFSGARVETIELLVAALVSGLVPRVPSRGSVGASGDLAYIVAFEHTTASVTGSPSLPYTLRATTVFRREAGEWKVVHRHADPVASENAAELVRRLVATDA